MAGEEDNDVIVSGPAFEGSKERYRISSYNRTKKSFMVLVYADGAKGDLPLKVSIPSSIRTGRSYHDGSSARDFRGEGFKDGDVYRARCVTKDISRDDGRDLNRSEQSGKAAAVTGGQLAFTVEGAHRFTKVEFSRE